MPYEIRDKDGELVGLTANRTDPDQKFIDEKSPEVVAMMKSVADSGTVQEAINVQMIVLAIKEMKAAGKIDAEYKEPVVPDVRSLTAGKGAAEI